MLTDREHHLAVLNLFKQLGVDESDPVVLDTCRLLRAESDLVIKPHPEETRTWLIGDAREPVLFTPSSRNQAAFRALRVLLASEGISISPGKLAGAPHSPQALYRQLTDITKKLTSRSQCFEFILEEKCIKQQDGNLIYERPWSCPRIQVLV